MQSNDCDPLDHTEIISDDKRRLIAMAGYKRSEKKLYYQLTETGGWYRDCRIERTYSFSPRIKSALTSEEKSQIKRAREKQRAERDAFDNRRRKKLGKWLSPLWSALPLAEHHEYLTRKNIQAHGARFRKKTGELIVPLYGADGKPYSLQKIKGKWKGFVKGSSPSDNYFPFAERGEDRSVLLLAEGWATAATIREATVLPTIAAFTAGNLVSVAQYLRKKYPASKIVVCADNDHKNPKNIGIEKAQQAAASIGGAHVIWPIFSENSDSTDWNDYAALYGLDAVREKILWVIAQSGQQQDAHNVTVAGSNPAHPTNEIRELNTPEEAAPVFHESPPTDDLQHGGGDEPRGDFGLDFRALGYNGDFYYYFPFKKRQIVTLTASAHTVNNLFQLDDLDAWQRRFGDDKANPAKFISFAANAMMQKATSRGVFKQEDRVRGCGAWMDEGRMVLHCGDLLYVNGDKYSFDDLQSEYTYIASARLLVPAAEPLDNNTAYKLRKICEAPTWENPLSGSLLAGWLVIAQICAALEYRPHIYLSGESMSGKSSVVNKVIRRVLGKYALRVGGNTTEPSVREQMGYDARPLIFDEAEPSASIHAVIDLARMASTGEIVKKFGQNPFNARFCACFSAINPPISKTADESRHSLLVLKKNRKPSAMQEYNDWLALIDETLTDDFGPRLIARILGNLDSLFKNIATFQRAFRIVTQDARASEHIGTMLAGLYLLGRTGKITEEDAIKWVQQYKWNDHTIIDQEADSIRLVHRIASSLIRYHTGTEISIAELISMVHRDRDTKADSTLRNYGIAVKGDLVSIASRSHNLQRLLKETDWHEKWSRTLADVPGAMKSASEYFSKGIKTSAVKLPISVFLEEEVKDFAAPVQEEILF